MDDIEAEGQSGRGLREPRNNRSSLGVGELDLLVEDGVVGSFSEKRERNEE